MRVLNKKSFKKGLLIILAVILTIAAAGLGYWLSDISNNEIESGLNKEITTLKEQISNLNNKLDDESDSDVLEQIDNTKAPSNETLDNIKAAISIGNTQPLEGYMASVVRVILAASEGIGDRTPAQATLDITNFIEDAGSWNFNLSASVLNSYSNSFYGQYFPSNAIVGKSSTNKIISISFDENAKINTVFFASHEEVVTNN